MRIFIISVFLCAYALGTPFPIYHKDDKGYSTIIVKKPERIVIAGGLWPLPSAIIMLEGSAKHLVYMPKASKNVIEHTFLPTIFPEVDSVKFGDSENIEELLRLKPDLFMCHDANIKVGQ